MLSFKQFLIEAPSWEDHLRQIGHVVRDPDSFGVEFVDTDYLDPEFKTTGEFNPNTFKIKIATRGNENTSPRFRDSTFLNSGVFGGEVDPSIDDNLAHEGAHLIQKARQMQKHGYFSGMKGRAGPYQRRQIEIDARSAARGSRIVSTYNQRLADLMDRFPALATSPEGIDTFKRQLRGLDFRSARAAESVGAAEKRLGKVPYRRAKQTDKQTMAAIYAAEKGLPQNLTDPEVMKDFIERHKVKTPEATTPTRQATPSPEVTIPAREATPSLARRAAGTVADIVIDPTDLATRNLKPGPAMVAGAAGGLAGEHIVKPAAEKAGVFDAVGRVSKAAFERMPPAAVDFADKALGAANYVLGGGPVDQLTTDAVKGVQSGMEGIMRDRAEQQKKTGRTNYSAPFGY